MGSSSQNDNIFRILVATDNHLGYAEKDPERGNDSFNTFEEILELGVEEDVDFILLGGDLFHDNKPTRNTMIKCSELLRKYTLGDKPVYFDFLSDPAINFPHMKNPVANYLDPNLNIGIPVFSIHGNHDDPIGPGQFCALEQLSSVGLVNYFGRTSSLKEIVINPILLQKGESKLALYGLSAMKDERLFRLFNEKKVTMLRPKEDTDDWCNVMVVHQNHTEHGPTNYLPESFLDEFLDLVIWGHEHECIINPTSSKSQNFFVTQPGSSVATSLCKGESVDKKVGILEIATDKAFRMLDFPLKTVRPLIFDDLILSQHGIGIIEADENNVVEELVCEQVNKMIELSKTKITGHERQPTKPLIRLRVEYNHESQIFNINRFAFKFTDSVANPSDMILFRKERENKKPGDTANIDEDVLDAIFNDEEIHEQKVEDLVENYFANLEDDNMKLQLLTETGLARAVTSFVEKDNKDSIEEIVKHQMKKACEYLMKIDDLQEEDIDAALYTYKTDRINRHKEEEDKEVENVLVSQEKNVTRTYSDNDSNSDNSEFEAPTRGRGRGRGRGSRGGKGKASPKKPLNIVGASSTRGRGRGSRGGRGKPIIDKSSSRSIMESFTRSRNTSRRKVYSSDSD